MVGFDGLGRKKEGLSGVLIVRERGWMDGWWLWRGGRF